MEKRDTICCSLAHDPSRLEDALDFLKKPAFRDPTNKAGLKDFHEKHLQKLRERLKLGECATILATLGDEDGLLVGALVFDSLQENAETLRVEALGVSRTYRDQGVATEMIAMLKRKAEKHGVEKIAADIPQGAEDLQSLAAKNGANFQRVKSADGILCLRYEGVVKSNDEM